MRRRPNEWSEWAQATARRFYRRNPPSVVLDGDMEGFAKTMLDVLVDYPRRPPPVSTVKPPTRPLDLPPWTIPGREQGESSRSAGANRARIEDRDRYDEEEESDEESEYDEEEGDDHEIGDDEEEERQHVGEDEKGKAVLEEEDSDEDEDPEEGPYIEVSDIEEAKFIPPPPPVPPPVVPPSPVQTAYDYVPHLPPSGPYYYVDYSIPMGYGYGAQPGPFYYMATPEVPEPIVDHVIPEVQLSPLVEEIFSETQGKTMWDPIWIYSDSEEED